MRDIEITSASVVLTRALDLLLAFKGTGARDAADLRRLVGALKVNGPALIKTATVSADMGDVFAAASLAGAITADWQRFRSVTAKVPVIYAPDAVIKNGCLQLALIEEVKLTTDTDYVSRSQVVQVQEGLAAAFDEVIETASDDRAVEVVRDMTTVQAATARHLAVTSRPLPDMIDYKVPRRLPSLVIAHRLYQDAGRANELLLENSTIHPAFMAATGTALSR